MNKSIVAASAAAFLHFHPSGAVAATLPADGYIYSRTVLSQFTEGCVAEGPGGVFVGVGAPLSFPPAPATRSIVFVSEGGGERTVATGLNAIGDCLYDGADDILYVTDNGGNYSGAVTGDTVFAIASASSATSVAVAGHELVPAGSIGFASNLARLGDELLVSNPVGAGTGEVVAIDLGGAPPTLSSFATGLDYAGGLAVSGDDVLLAESRSGTFDNQIRRYSSAGVFQGLVSGPTYAHGSIDLAVQDSGDLVITGNDTVVGIDDMGAASPLVTGLDGGTGFAAFGGGVSIDGAGGRIDFAASSFSGADDDRSLHRLVPVDHLVPGGDSTASECVHEFYGVTLVPAKPGRKAKTAICQDGAACDADGVVNDVCRFPVGFCVNVSDARFATCTPSGIAAFELLAAKPASAALTTAAADVQEASPTTASCFFSDGISVPLRVGGNGRRGAGRGVVRVRATTDDASPRNDTDVLRLLCQPTLG